LYQDFELPVQNVRLRSEVKGLRKQLLFGLPFCTVQQTERAGQVTQEGEIVMRSDLVFGALSHVTNRYKLCQLASKATRKLHKPNTRLQDTTNEVLVRFHTTNPGTAAPQEKQASESVERRRAA
jgi:hypothetical protein